MTDKRRTDKRGANGCFILVLISAGLLIGLPLLVFAFWTLASSRSVETRLAEIRNQGYSVSTTELQEYYFRVAPEVKDSTELWVEGTAALADSTLRQHLPWVGRSAYPVSLPGQP